jgi:hypothetical protein
MVTNVALPYHYATLYATRSAILRRMVLRLLKQRSLVPARRLSWTSPIATINYSPHFFSPADIILNTDIQEFSGIPAPHVGAYYVRDAQR